MTTENTTPDKSAEEAATTDPDVLREEIAQTREELGDTVEALAAKADVKGRARDRAEELKAQARARRAQAVQALRTQADHTKRATGSAAQSARRQPAVPLGAAGAAVAIVVVFLLRRRLTARGPAGRTGGRGRRVPRAARRTGRATPARRRSRRDGL
jgi:uncharacterized protein DUF3618